MPRPALALLVVLAGCSGGTGSDSPNQRTASGDRLVISSEHAGNVTPRLIDESSHEKVFRRTYPPRTSIEVDEGVEPGVTYRAVTLVGDEVAWNRTVYDYESYQLAITENGSVRVDTHVEV